MSSRRVLFVDIEAQIQTILENVLEGWEHLSDGPGLLDRIPDGTDLVVIQSRGDERELLGWVTKIREQVGRSAKILVALDPDLAGQCAPAMAAGADQCLMVPAAYGHVERLIQRLLEV